MNQYVKRMQRGYPLSLNVGLTGEAYRLVYYTGK